MNLRIRTIKPDFWTDEAIVALSFPARLLFVGLWQASDRRGRLEDRPKKLKLQLFPADAIDIDALLAELVRERLIVRYEVEGQRLIWIPGLEEHQRFSGTEAKSESRLPEPPLEAVAASVEAVVASEEAQAASGREGKGKEGKGKEERSAARSAGAPEEQARLELDEDSGPIAPEPASDEATPERVFDLYLAVLPVAGWTKHSKLTKGLRASISARLREAAARRALGWWEALFVRTRQRVTWPPAKGCATLEFIVRSEDQLVAFADGAKDDRNVKPATVPVQARDFRREAELQRSRELEDSFRALGMLPEDVEPASRDGPETTALVLRPRSSGYVGRGPREVP